MALTIEDLLNMQAAPRQAVSADVPGILAAMMANRQQGMPELPNMPAPIQPIALPSLGDGGGHGGGGAGLAQQAISSLMGEYFQNRADEKQTKAESEQAKLLAQYAPQLYDERILAEKDPRAAAQLRADRAAFASGNPILAKTGVKNYESYLTSRMPDINASETIKNVRAATNADPGTPEFQAGMKQELQQKNAPTGMYRNERGELAFSPLAGGGTYQDIQDRISPLERSKLAIQQAQERRAIEQSKIDKEPLTQVSGPDGLPMWVKRSEAEGKQAYSPTGISNKLLPTGQVDVIRASKNTVDAIGKYRDKYNKFEALDILNPDKHVDLSSSYKNVLLQAQQVYGLGVLNPNDEKVLAEILTNPISVMGSIASKDAMNKQINDVETIIKGMGETASKPYTVDKQQATPKPQLTPEQALEMLKKNGARFQ